MLYNYSINKALGLPDIFLVQEKIINNNSYLYLSLPKKHISVLNAIRKPLVFMTIENKLF